MYIIVCILSEIYTTLIFLHRKIKYEFIRITSIHCHNIVCRFRNLGPFKVSLPTEEEIILSNNNITAHVSVCDGMLKVYLYGFTYPEIYK